VALTEADLTPNIPWGRHPLPTPVQPARHEVDPLCVQYIFQNCPWHQAEASQSETTHGELDLAVGMVERSYLWAEHYVLRATGQLL